LAGIEDGAQVNVQSDHAQNDSAAPDYIKNRLAWDDTEIVETVIFEEQIEGGGARFHDLGADSIVLKPNTNYKVVFNKTEYNVKSSAKINANEFGSTDYDYVILMGNLGFANIGENTGEPFYFFYMYNDSSNGAAMYTDGPYDIITLSVFELVTQCSVHMIDPKYYERLAWSEIEDGETVLDLQLEVGSVDNRTDYIGL